MQIKRRSKLQPIVRKPAAKNNPVKLTPLTLEIQNLSQDGRGIGRHDGKTIFVAGALPGETVTAKIVRQQKRFDEAVLLDILRASSSRVTPVCEYFTKCGGCALQHLQAEKQIEFKQQYFLESLQRIAGLSVENVMPSISGPLWQYRRKARLSTSYDKKTKLLQIGFRENDSSEIVAIRHCDILEPPFNTNLYQISDLINSLEMVQAISHIELAKADNANAIVLRHVKPLPNGDCDKLVAFAKAKNIQLYLLGDTPQELNCLWPENSELKFKLAEQDIEFAFLPTDFVQVNAEVNQRLINRTLDLLAPGRDDIVLDLFCGVGNFALPVAKQVKKVIGAEGDNGLVQRARLNAERNSCDNAEFFCADLTKEVKDSHWFRQNSFNKIILDPPRGGAFELMPLLGSIKPERIIYISCDAATLARDVAELAKYKYRIKQAGVMDMFPHTAHVESIVLLQRK